MTPNSHLEILYYSKLNHLMHFAFSPMSAQKTLQDSDNAVNNPMVAQASAHVQGSNVAKCLFTQSSHIVPNNSPIPKTPPRANSSQCDTNISPNETSSVAACNAPTRCTVISTKRVMVSPAKQMAYIEMSHCISPIKTNLDKASKRDHVRSRLDFDSADVPDSLNNPLVNELSTSESEKEMDIFDIDFSNFEGFGMDFSINDMLNELDHLSCEGNDYSCHQTSSLSMDNDSGYCFCLMLHCKSFMCY